MRIYERSAPAFARLESRGLGSSLHKYLPQAFSQTCSPPASHPCTKGPRCRSAAGATNRHQMARPSASQATQSDAERRRVVLLGWVADAESGSANPIFPEHRFNASNLTPNTLQHLETFKERRPCRGQCRTLPSLAARDSGLHGATGTLPLRFPRPENPSKPPRLLDLAQEKVARHGRRDRSSRSCRGFVPQSPEPFSPNSRKSSNCGTKAVAAAAAQEPRSTLSTDHARRPEDVPPRSGMMAGRTLTMECLCPSRGSTVGVSSFRSSCGAGENVQGFERKLYSNACTSQLFQLDCRGHMTSLEKLWFVAVLPPRPARVQKGQS